jgi:uncharacterized protein (UPF0248 family)
VIKAIKVSKAFRDNKAILVHRVIRVIQGQKAIWDLRDKQGLLVLKALLLDLQDKRDLLVLKALLLVQQDQKVIKAIKDRLVFRVIPGHRVILVIQGQKVI